MKHYKVYAKTSSQSTLKKISSGLGFRTKQEAQHFARGMRKYYKNILIY